MTKISVFENKLSIIQKIKQFKLFELLFYIEILQKSRLEDFKF